VRAALRRAATATRGFAAVAAATARRSPAVAPITLVAAAWLAGTLLVHELPRLPSISAYAPLGLGALLALRFARTRWLVFVLAGFGWTAFCAGERLGQRLSPADLGRDFALTGYIDSFPAVAPGQITFSFKVAEPRAAGVPPRVRLTWYDAPSAIAPGNSLAVVARLRPPHGSSNPGGFDYERWLMLTGHGATGYVRSGGLAPTAPLTIAQRWLVLRAELAERIGTALSDPDAAALVTALAIGERFRFTEQHWADFRRTGTSHLVAVSGMHVALIGVLVFLLLRALCTRLPQPFASYDLEAAATASALCTAYYAALTGLAVPAQRSLLMIVAVLALLVSRRSVGASQVLAATLLAVIVWDPFAPLAASFWLSYGAVAILLALAAPRRLPREAVPLWRRVLHPVSAFASLQWSIGVALLPLTAAFFAEVSLVGPLVNLVAIPLFNLVLVPLALLATLLLHVDAGAATLAPPLLELVGALAARTVAFLHAVAAAPWAAWAVPPAPRATLGLAACGVALALCARPFPGRRLAWLALLPMFYPMRDVPEIGAARVVVLDVGHGLAVSVATTAHRLLYDAGPSFRSGFDSGTDVVLPALAASGVRRLDRLIVSHADNDHAGGAAAVLAAFPGADVLKGPDVAQLPGRTCERGERWDWDGVEFAILHPGADFGARGNESSCVLKVSARGGSVLIAGDIEARGEGALVLMGGIASDVVVVPHHGSATSSSQAFVDAVRPALALVSAGHANRWGFPRPAVRARWERAGARMAVTGDDGALTVLLDGAGPVLIPQRARRTRYWHAQAASVLECRVCTAGSGQGGEPACCRPTFDAKNVR
jgi:competence protein ComEC